VKYNTRGCASGVISIIERWRLRTISASGHVVPATHLSLQVSQASDENCGTCGLGKRPSLRKNKNKRFY
jgi:hypothetical protein